ncbi:MAG TPA: hypothetical protein VFY29_10320 [Terriglobia bacterium]|nr:hypothetical protein [Terriglobia bacterium]
MAAIILQCRKCEAELQTAPATGLNLVCPQCREAVPLRLTESLARSGPVDACAACGHDRLYIQKDFNRNLGLAIVIGGAVISVLFFAFGYPFYAMLTLGVTAVVDILVYSLVGTVTVCYVCHTIYRGFERNPAHGPFDLKDLEKFGGREPRF